MSNPYPTLLRIDWDFYVNVMINLNKRGMVFEKNELRVIFRFDLCEGAQYTEPNHDYYEDDEIDHIYKLIAWNEDWINPNVDGRISWEKENAYQSDSNEGL